MAADKRKYQNPRRNMPGVKLPDAPTQAVEARAFELLRGFEFTDHLQFTLDDSPQPRSGSRGPFLNKLTAEDSADFGITFALAGDPEWGLGIDENQAFSLFDHSAAGATLLLDEGTAVFIASPADRDTVDSSTKFIFSHNAGSPAAFSNFFTLEAKATLAGLNVSVANSSSATNTNSISITQRDANHFSTINFDSAMRIIVDDGLANTSTFTIRDDAAAADRLRIDATGLVTMGAVAFTDLTATGNVTFSKVPAATTQRGVVALGDGGFTGGAGHYVGSSSGTYLALNAGSTFAGDLVRVKQNGDDRWRLTSAGVVLQTTWGTTNTVDYPLAIRHGISTAATGGAIGIGAGIGFEIESSTDNTFVNIGSIGVESTAVGNGTQSGKMLFNVRNAGAVVTPMVMGVSDLTVVGSVAGTVTFTVKGASGQSVNVLECQDNLGSATGRFRVVSTGVPSCPGGGTGSERYGEGSSAAGFESLALGATANASAAGGIAIGWGAAATTASSMIAIGLSCTVTGSASVGIGNTTVVGHDNCVVLGYGISSTASGQFIVGGNSTPISTAYLGSGITDTSPTSLTLNATGGSGSNKAGASLSLAAGRGTGSAVGGSIKLQSTIAGGSSSTLRTLQDKWVMTNVGIWQGWQPSSTTDRQAFDITPTWSTATDASRKARCVFNIWDTAAREAMRIEADGSNPMIGFLGASAAAKQGSTTDLKDLIVTFGLLTDSGATPLNLDGGALSAGAAAFSGTVGGESTAFQWKSATVTPGSDADYTLTSTEMACHILTIAVGAWTVGRNIIVPAAAGGEWHISNSTGFVITVKTAAGTGINIAVARAATLRANGTNVRRVTPDCDPTV